MHIRTVTLSLAIVLTAFTPGCKPTGRLAGPAGDRDLLQFASLLTGNFSSEAQSKTDSAYFNISLSMTRIWADRTDGIWLYVEQAVATQKDKPYRQRVYQLAHPEKDQFTSEIYTIKDKEQFIGLQNDPAKMQLLSPDKIELKDGCTVILTREKGTYRGGTEGNGCKSDLRGAAYATTKIVLTEGMLESWDQGFDSAGTQVWGAVKGGYRFIKQ